MAKGRLLHYEIQQERNWSLLEDAFLFCYLVAFYQNVDLLQRKVISGWVGAVSLTLIFACHCFCNYSHTYWPISGNPAPVRDGLSAFFSSQGDNPVHP